MQFITRKQRRIYEKFLKKTSLESYHEWKSGSLKRGKALHQNHVESVISKIMSQYEDLQNKIFESLRLKNWKEEDIKEYVEDWVASIKVWSSEEKPGKWKDLRKGKIM